jgi:hypothetical protein
MNTIIHKKYIHKIHTYIKKYNKILNKLNIKPPHNEISYFDNALGGPRTKNTIGEIVFTFEQKENYNII